MHYHNILLHSLTILRLFGIYLNMLFKVGVPFISSHNYQRSIIIEVLSLTCLTSAVTAAKYIVLAYMLGETSPNSFTII